MQLIDSIHLHAPLTRPHPSEFFFSFISPLPSPAPLAHCRRPCKLKNLCHWLREREREKEQIRIAIDWLTGARSIESITVYCSLLRCVRCTEVLIRSISAPFTIDSGHWHSIRLWLPVVSANYDTCCVLLCLSLYTGRQSVGSIVTCTGLLVCMYILH